MKTVPSTAAAFVGRDTELAFPVKTTLNSFLEALDIQQMKTPTSNIIAFVCHSLACALFILIGELCLSLYKNFQGSFDSRGYAPGAVTRLAFLHMVISSFLIAVTPWRAIKVGIVVLTSVSLAWLLLPYHPLRASFYCGLLLVLSICAMAAESLIRRRYGVGQTT